ncbi:hypothetical protein NC653_029027 [Populus alba x Populus x berolinensis]|uniref:Uncharacterized protein n=1 Tax=Populus alba x Populus x berolinensis TaxID=444605 RepID=A0AAD6Q2P6_9ROSI|nr:hypothetical protein NC653_029027 [Populus alba x Populus x berolinensis]
MCNIVVSETSVVTALPMGLSLSRGFDNLNLFNKLPVFETCVPQFLRGDTKAHSHHPMVWENVLCQCKILQPGATGLSNFTAKSASVKQIGFRGLAAMGFGMAAHMLKCNFFAVVCHGSPHFCRHYNEKLN